MTRTYDFITVTNLLLLLLLSSQISIYVCVKSVLQSEVNLLKISVDVAAAW